MCLNAPSRLVGLLLLLPLLLSSSAHSDLSVKYTLSMPRREQQHQVFARSIDASPVEECGVPTTVPLQRRDGDLEFEGTLSDRDAILAQGFDIIHEQYGEPFHRLRKRSRGRLQGYHHPEELFGLFSRLEASRPSVAQLVNLTDKLRAPATFEGRSIFALRVAVNVTAANNRPNVLIVSNHHARELMTPEIALDVATRLVRGYGVDSGLTQYISSFNTYIVWTLNPDGLAHVWTTDNMWRKNRSPNQDGSFGVDLNRNYPTGWRLPCGGDLEPRSNAYRGQRAASESETQTMLLLQAQIRPYKMLDLHSHGREVRIPYAAECMRLPPQVSAAFESAGKALAARMSSGAVQYTQTRSCCVGGNIHDAVNKYATLAMLVETGTSFQPPKPDLDLEKALVWSGIQAWLLYRAGVEGVVTDSQTGTPVAATINVAPVIFAFGEQNQAAPDTGLFHLWLAPGNYSLTFSAPHYLPLLLTVTVGDFGVGGAHLQLNMQRTN